MLQQMKQDVKTNIFPSGLVMIYCSGIFFFPWDKIYLDTKGQHIITVLLGIDFL